MKKKLFVQFSNSTNWYPGKNLVKRKTKTHVLLENNPVARMSTQKKKQRTELPKVKRNKVINTWDRVNIMKIIPTT